jgi:hypothetical protein
MCRQWIAVGITMQATLVVAAAGRAAAGRVEEV